MLCDPAFGEARLALLSSSGLSRRFQDCAANFREVPRLHQSSFLRLGAKKQSMVRRKLHSVRRKVTTVLQRDNQQQVAAYPESDHTPSTNAEPWLAEAIKQEAMMLYFDVSLFHTAAWQLYENLAQN